MQSFHILPVTDPVGRSLPPSLPGSLAGVFFTPMNDVTMPRNYHEKPEVLELANQLGIPPLHVVGCMYRVCAWLEDHGIEIEGPLVSIVAVDSLVGIKGFAAAAKRLGIIDPDLFGDEGEA